MYIYGLIHNKMKNNSDWPKMDYAYTSSTAENETFYLARNDSEIAGIVPLSLTSAIFLSTPAKSNRSHVYNSNNTRDEFQFYIIGIYSFFAVVFGFGLLVILFKKLQKACCTSSKTEAQDYESVPNPENLSQQDNLAFDHHVNVNYLDVGGRNNGDDSDYEYYSDASNGERHSEREKPPAYEDPPAYSIVLQN